jgi:hypothetical protein
MADIFDKMEPAPEEVKTTNAEKISTVDPGFMQGVQDLNRDYPDVKFDLAIRKPGQKPGTSFQGESAPMAVDIFDKLEPTKENLAAAEIKPKPEITVPQEPIDNAPVEQKVSEAKAKRDQLLRDIAAQGVPPSVVKDAIDQTGSQIKDATTKVVGKILLPPAMIVADLLSRSMYAKNAAIQTLWETGQEMGLDLSPEQLAEEIRKDPVKMAAYEQSPIAYTGKIAIKNLAALAAIYQRPEVKQKMALAAGVEILSGLGDIRGKKPTVAEWTESAGVPKGIIPGNLETISDVLPGYYSATGDEWTKLQKGGLLDPSARGLASFLVDVGTDLLVFVSLGGAGAIRLLTKDGKVLHLTEAGKATRAAEIAKNLGSDFELGTGAFTTEQLNPAIRQRLTMLNGGGKLPEQIHYGENPELYNAGVNAAHSTATETILDAIKDPLLKSTYTNGRGIDIRVPFGKSYHLADWDQLKTPLQSTALWAATRYGAEALGVPTEAIARELTKAGGAITRANESFRDFTAKHFKGSMLNNPYIKLNKDAYLDDAVYIKAIADRKIEKSLANFYDGIGGTTGTLPGEIPVRIHERQLWDLVKALTQGRDPGFLLEVPYAKQAQEIADVIIKNEDALKMVKGNPNAFSFGFSQEPEVVAKVIQSLQQRISRIPAGANVRDMRDPLNRMIARKTYRHLAPDGISVDDFNAREELIDASRMFQDSRYHLTASEGMATGIRNKVGTDALTSGRNMYGQWLVKQFGGQLDNLMKTEIEAKWGTPLIDELPKDYTDLLQSNASQKVKSEINAAIVAAGDDLNAVHDIVNNPYKYIKTRIAKAVEGGGQSEYVTPFKNEETARKLIFHTFFDNATVNTSSTEEAMRAYGRVLDMLDEHPDLMRQIKPTVVDIPRFGYKDAVPMEVLIDGKPRKLQVPRDVAKDWERIPIEARKDPQTKGLVRMIDGYTNFWKYSRTAPFPSFSIRNATQNAMVNYLRNGVNAFRNRALTAKLMYLTGEIPGANKLQIPGVDSTEIFVTDTGAKYTLGEISSQIEAHGVLQSTGNVMEATGRGQPLPGIGAAKTARDTALYQERLAKSLVDKSRQSTMSVVASRLWDLGTTKGIDKVKILGKLARGIDNYERVNLYINSLRRGLSPAEAAKEVHDFLVDYTKLSEFEQTWARRIVPFYGFYRLGTPQWLKAAVLEPSRTNRLTYLTREDSRRDAIGRDSDYMASYRISDRRIRLSSDGKTSHVIEGIESPLTPLSIFNPLFQDPNKAVGLFRTAVSVLNPGLAQPIQWMTGMDAGRGTPIQGVPAQTLGEVLRHINADSEMRGGILPFVMKPDPNNPHKTLYELTPNGGTMANIFLMSRFINEADTILEHAQKDPEYGNSAWVWLNAFLNSQTIAGVSDKTIDVDEEYLKRLREINRRLTSIQQGYDPNR